MESLFYYEKIKNARFSSYDKTGGNKDWVDIEKNSNYEINIDKQCNGVIKHIWMTIGSEEINYLRNVILEIYWDDEINPSVLVPIGDFFGIGFGISKQMDSAVIQRSPHKGKGMNCYFPMPFLKNAKIVIRNETEEEIMFYYNIDIELKPLEKNLLYFHANYNHVRETKGWADNVHLSKATGFDKKHPWIPNKWETKNIDGMNNYSVLNAKGKGKFVGMILNIDNFEPQTNYWYGEGDEMIYIDGDTLPTINGTGTEDYFNTAFGPSEEFCSLYHGITIYSGDNFSRQWAGKNSMYRFHIQDPIYFSESIKFTIEHGHANKLSNDYSSVAYWYQTEPHIKLDLPNKEIRKPRG